MTRILTLIILFLSLFSFFGCSKTENKPANSTGGNTWKMGDYRYTRGTSSGGFGGAVTALVISTSGFGNANGSFSGSGLSFTFWGAEPGTYLVKSAETVARAHNDNPSLKYLNFSCSVGTESPNSTLYVSQDSEATAVVSIIDGKYNISIEREVILLKSVNTGTGVPNAPSTFSFTCKDVR